MSRVIAFTLVFLVVPFAVRAQDEFGDIRARQEIAVQKLTKQVADALADSRQMQRIDPDLAKVMLNRTLTQVRESQDLLAEKRADFVRRLQIRINEVDDVARGKRINDDLKPLAQKPKPKSSGNYEDPRPKSPASIAKDFTGSVKAAQDTHRETIAKREVNSQRVLMTIEKGYVIPGESGIDFGSKAYWLSIKDRGKPQLTAKEAMLLKSLNSVMTVNYEGDKFGLVLNHIAEKAQLTILVDEASKEEARLDYEDPVNFKLPVKVTVRTALKKILGDKGLTYVIKEGAIHVMTPKKASEITVVRSYPISDLIQPSMAAQMFGPFVAQAQMNQNAFQLVQLIQTTVGPGYWEPNGPGSIVYYPPARSLIIRGSAEMHYQLGGMSLLGR